MTADGLEHMAVTLVAIPSTAFIIKYLLSKKEKAEDIEENNWRGYVTKQLESLTTKLTSYCKDNHTEHEQLFNEKNSLVTRVTEIETIHHQRGCDQPFLRRKEDIL